MIHYTTGDIFDSGAMALVNTVNTEGVMGKGLALQFKKRFPNNFREYVAACKKHEVRLGTMFITSFTDDRYTHYIINFPTKDKWRNKSKLINIQSGLVSLKEDITRLNITSIAIPPLGCGLGGLRWYDVRSEIEKIFSDLDNIEVFVYEPLLGPNPAPRPAELSPMTKSKSLILRCYQRYLNLVPSITMTFVEAHKLTYFLQEMCDVGLRLKFAAWKYGPFAVNLAQVLGDMEGRWIKGFGDGTRKAFDTFTLLPAAAEAENFPISKDYERALQHVDSIYAGFESPLGLELLATIHWLVHKNSVAPEVDAIQTALAVWEGNKAGWGERKVKLFPSRIIEMGLNHLQQINQ